MAEYYIRRINVEDQPNRLYFTVAKFMDRNEPEQVYTIQGRTLDTMNCNCPASHRDPNCKHRWMLQGWLDNLTDIDKVTHYYSDKEDAFVEHPYFSPTIRNLAAALDHAHTVNDRLHKERKADNRKEGQTK
jgi:hypothetical protein